MKVKRKDILILIMFVVLAAFTIWFEVSGVKISSDALTNTLAHSAVLRAAAGGFALALCIYTRSNLSIKVKDKRALIWTIPCAFTVIANLPMSALIMGTAAITRADLIYLFAIDCVLTGFFEELLFRVVFQDVFFDLFKDKKYRLFWTVLFTSALFGLWHLTNLFSGADVGYTLLQVGYGFLIGAMFSAIRLKTGNIWLCVIFHALFNFFGLIVPTIGAGDFQDLCFWILTAVFGVLNTIHVLIYLIKDGKNSKPTEGDNKDATEEQTAADEAPNISDDKQAE